MRKLTYSHIELSYSTMDLTFGYIWIEREKKNLLKKKFFSIFYRCDRNWILKARKAHEMNNPIPLQIDIDINTDKYTCWNSIVWLVRSRGGPLPREIDKATFERFKATNHATKLGWVYVKSVDHLSNLNF